MLGGVAGLGLIAPALGLADGVVVDEQARPPSAFSWHPGRSPKGLLAIVVSPPDQSVHVCRNSVRIAVSTCSAGEPGHETPRGGFTILQKDKDRRSSTCNDAAMPNKNPLTLDGIALHAGNLPGYPASRRCFRQQMTFSEKLFGLTLVGTPAIIAGAASDPCELSHPGLVLANGTESEMDTADAAPDGKADPAD